MNYPFILIIIFYCLNGICSIAEPDVKWPKNEIVVCFGEKQHWSLAKVSDSPLYSKLPAEDEAIQFTDKQKELIEKIISNNFEAKTTGIHFSGWHDCESISDFDVIILRTHKARLSANGEASIGFRSKPIWKDLNGKEVSGYAQDLSLKKYEYVLIDTFKEAPKVSIDDKIKYTTLHEFGHLAGLRHEHSRLKEALKDQNCLDAELDKLPTFLQEKEGFTSKSYGPYDPNSIMNYCFKDILHFKTGLNFQVKESDLVPLVLTDDSLYQWGNLFNGFIEYSVRVKLSSGDKSILKILYSFP